MVDNSSTETTPDRARFSRRGYLVAGGLSAGLVGGYVGLDRFLEQRSTDDSPPLGDPPVTGEDFLWLGGGLWHDVAIRENLFAFARRHDLAVILVVSDLSDGAADEAFETVLTAASEFDLDVWLNVGLLNAISASAFVTEDDTREEYLGRLREVVAAHGDLFDTGRVVLWQEAPVMGQWAEGGEWNQAAVGNLVEFGPQIFDAQKRAVESENDALEVGLFVHFPYIVDSKRPEVFESLARGLRQRNAMPDFGFVDFYRGWYEKDVGPQPANAAVRSLVSNVRAALDDRPVFYLGQSHTINPNHTPSKQAMRMNLRASLESGAAGLGWYIRGGYVPTESGFDPFVPNVDGAEVDGDSITTLTVARDRFLYPSLATLAAGDRFEADEAFDLWLVGDELGFYDHRLSLRTADGGWEYVGDVGGYADGEYPDGSAATDRATVFRGLDRDRFLDGGALDCRLETVEDGSGTDLQAAFVMPCDPDDYVSERDAARFARGDAPLEEFSLGQRTDRTPLVPGERRRVTIPITDAAGESLERLRHPDHADLIGRLASFEERESVDPAARFDCWMSGSGLAEPAALPSIVDGDGTERTPDDVGFVASTDSLAIWYGLERDRFLGEDGLEVADDAAAAVDAVYAMPYAGSTTFRAPTRAAALLDEQPDEAERFALEYTAPD
ncbi:hypothetical protein [Natrinema salaciae]|uniref:Uncharacterized protein n=1 Tax=Natrinema salaciae TaxID=1186196 RepID=A0A1H9SB24_9EURY|nr:hypothetical protein [Natrinema salaciae]SER82128.1 hypothetical protein SAMN04489841_4658 [Natrinema salaciae]